MPLTKFIKIQKVLTDTSTEASLCRSGAGEREKCEGAGDDGKGKSLPIVPRALIAIFTGIPSGSLCRGERSNRYFPLGGQRWRSGESTRLPPMRPGFKSRRRRHMWVEFVDGSLPCSDSKTARNVIVGWKTKKCTNLKLFLGSIPIDTPLPWSAFGALTFLPARTPSKSKATPLIHIPIGTHLCYFLEIRSKLNTMPAPRSVKIDNPRIFTANNSLMERIVIELRD